MTSLLQSIINKSPILFNLNLIQHRFIDDIQNNFDKSFHPTILSDKTTFIIAFAICINEKNTTLYSIFVNSIQNNLISENELSEIHSIVSIMNMNNSLYSFKSKMNNETYNNYPIGLNMSSFAKTNIDKINFELIALTISNINQCKPCTVHHEKKCVELGISNEQIYKAIQLSSFVKSLCVFEYSKSEISQ